MADINKILAKTCTLLKNFQIMVYPDKAAAIFFTEFTAIYIKLLKNLINIQLNCSKTKRQCRTTHKASKTWTWFSKTQYYTVAWIIFPYDKSSATGIEWIGLLANFDEIKFIWNEKHLKSTKTTRFQLEVQTHL